MNASGENFCQKSRGYAKIGIGSQYGLAKISFEVNDYRQIGSYRTNDKDLVILTILVKK